ncbi:hypothetical protein GCM10023148_33850 [Actinokineospora soli]
MADGTDPQAVIDAHLAAIPARDLAGYAATLHPDVVVVVTSGRVMTGAAEVTAFHEAWFAEPGWTYEAVTTHRTTAAGVATRVVEVTYVDGPGATPSRFAMGLVFVPVGGRWLLVHDQCTPRRTE